MPKILFQERVGGEIHQLFFNIDAIAERPHLKKNSCLKRPKHRGLKVSLSVPKKIILTRNPNERMLKNIAKRNIEFDSEN